MTYISLLLKDMNIQWNKTVNFFRRFLIYLIIVLFEFSGGVLLSLTFLILPFTYAIIAIITLMLIYRIRLPFEFNGSLSLNWLRTNTISRFMRKGEKWKTTFMSKLEPEETYIFVAYPHGMLPISWLFFLKDLADYKLFPRIMCADVIMRIPITREIACVYGLVNASWKSLQIASKNKQSVFLLPGSVSEMKYSGEKGKEIRIIKRNGFLKAAFEHGFTMLPVMGVGVNNLYKPFVIHSEWFKKVFGIYPFVPFGKYEICYPKSTPVENIIGNPIKVEKKANPSKEDIEELSKKFYKGLEDALEFYNYSNSENYELCVVEK